MPTTLTESPAGTTVVVTQIAGTDLHVLTAWEPGTFTSHSAIRSDDAGGRLGQITARPLPANVEAMVPGSPERMAAAIDFHAANVLDAYATINAAYPGLGDRDDATYENGAVTCHGSPTLEPCHGGCGELAEPVAPLGIAWCGRIGR